MIKRIFESNFDINNNIFELKQHISKNRKKYNEFLWFKKKDKENKEDNKKDDNNSPKNKDKNKDKNDKDKKQKQPDAELMHTKLYKQIASKLPKTITITNKDIYNPAFGVKRFDIEANLEAEVSDKELTVTIKIETPKSKKTITSIFHLAPLYRLSELNLSGTVNNKEIVNNNQTIQISTPKEISELLLKSINKAIALEISTMIRKNKVENFIRRLM